MQLIPRSVVNASTLILEVGVKSPVKTQGGQKLLSEALTKDVVNFSELDFQG